MSTVRKNVQQAQRRLNANILFDRFTGAIFVGSLLAGLSLVAQRLLNLNIIVWPIVAALAVLLVGGWLLSRQRLTQKMLLTRGGGLTLLAAVAAGVALGLVHLLQPTFVEIQLLIAAAFVTLLLAVTDTVWHSVSPLLAAVKLDEAAGVRERISSAISLPASNDPFVQATHRDAERVAASVHVPAQLPLILPERTPRSLAATLAVLGIYMFLPQFDLLAREEQLLRQAEALAQREEVQELVEAFNREIEALQDLSKSHPALAALAEDLDPLNVPDPGESSADDVRRETLLKLEQVSDRLESKVMDSEAGMMEQLKKNLSRLEASEGNEAAKKLSQKLSEGDLKGAAEALEQLKQQLEKAQQGDPAAKAKLKDLGEQLEKMAQQLKELSDDNALQKALENQAGLSKEEAKKLLEKLAEQGETDPKALEKMLQEQLGDKLTPEQLKKLAEKAAQNNKACEKCKGLGEAIAKAAKAIAQGGDKPGNGAGDALAEAMGQLSDLEMLEQMMQDAQAQLDQLDNAQDDMGRGAQANPNNPRDQIGNQGGNFGLGRGERIGKEKVAHQTKRERAIGELSEGQIIGEFLVDAPLQRTELTTEQRDVVRSALREAEDVAENEDVPRQYSRSVKNYYDRLNGYLADEQEAK